MAHKSVKIGAVELPHNVILAPMSGITDKPFRHVVRKTGGGLVVSEMIASHAFLQDVWIELQKLKGAAQDEAPLSIQIAGWDPQMMAEAAKLAELSGAQLIDINMGCPAKKVTNRLSGSALMQDEIAAGEICRAVVRAVAVPVTLKTRLGWDDDHKNAPVIARIAQEEGIQALAIHGRTRTQMYKGQADWQTIAQTVAAVSIPVFANGDITSTDDAVQAVRQSGAAGVLVGRGAMGRPWFIGQVADRLANMPVRDEPNVLEKIDIIRCHTDELLTVIGQRGLRAMRKHYAAYCDGLAASDALKSALMRAATGDEAYAALTTYEAAICNEKAA